MKKETKGSGKNLQIKLGDSFGNINLSKFTILSNFADNQDLSGQPLI